MNPPTAVPKASYSQFGEDQGVLRFFGEEFKGLFLDVGANDGCLGSNSMLLELNGWRGVLVEPIARLAETCRRTRPNSVVINKAAVGDPKVGEVVLYEYYGVLPTGENYDGLSSVGVPSALESLAIAGGASIKKTVVPAATLDQMLEDIGFKGVVDFVSIDVEGFELEVLRGFSLHRHCPRLLVIEDNTFGKDYRVVSYLKSQGYFRVHRTGVNDWFVGAKDTNRFLARRIVLRFRLTLWKMRRAGRNVFLCVAGKKPRNPSSVSLHS